MTDEHESIEHELVRSGTLVDFDVVDTHVEPTAAGDESHVRITLQMSEGDVECFAFGLVYVRGRCLKTTVEVSSSGVVSVETMNRGEAALRWIDKLMGKKYLRAAE